MSKNTLIIISGGSGTGKTSVTNLLIQDPNIVKIITSTTRPKREGEEHGKDYYFISEEVFKQELEKGHFLEHVVYDGNYYGIHGKVIDLILGIQKKNAVIVMDVAGMRKIKNYCEKKGYNTVSFWFKTLAMEEAVKNMRKRNTSDQEIIRRLIIEDKEKKFTSEFTNVIATSLTTLENITLAIKKLAFREE